MTKGKETLSINLDYVNYTDVGELSSYEEDIVAPDADTWLQAMRSKMDSIKENNTWELVELPAGRKPLPYKWVLRIIYYHGSNHHSIEKAYFPKNIALSLWNPLRALDDMLY